MGIEKTIRVLKKIVGMAYNRTEFKNKFEEKIGGALYEYLKAEYAKANKETKWVTHWNNEVTRLVDTELVVILLHSSSFKNKIKAAGEVISDIKRMVGSYKRSAKNQLEKSYFNKKFKKEVDEKRIHAFFERIEKIVDSHLGSSL